MMPAYQIRETRPYGNSSSVEPTELFPTSIQSAFDRLEAIAKNGREGEIRPSPDNLAWAKKVLLRVLPRHYLVGAEIDAFQREIHVNWEHQDKRVTVFLPSPQQVKIYCEENTPDGVKTCLRPAANDPWEISGVLRWLFQ